MENHQAWLITISMWISVIALIVLHKNKRSNFIDELKLHLPEVTNRRGNTVFFTYNDREARAQLERVWTSGILFMKRNPPFSDGYLLRFVFETGLQGINCKISNGNFQGMFQSSRIKRVNNVSPALERSCNLYCDNPDWIKGLVNIDVESFLINNEHRELTVILSATGTLEISISPRPQIIDPDENLLEELFCLVDRFCEKDKKET